MGHFPFFVCWMLCKRPKRQHPHIFCFFINKIRRVWIRFFFEKTARRTFFIETKPWRRMLHLMCNINFTSDMIAGELVVHRAENWSGSRKGSWDFVLGTKMHFEFQSPQKKKNNIGNMLWSIDIPNFLTQTHFSTFAAIDTVPFCFFSYLPYIFQVINIQYFQSFFPSSYEVELLFQLGELFELYHGWSVRRPGDVTGWWRHRD